MSIVRREKSTLGFTLFEILIALFIFTILSIIMISALHTVIDAESGVEKNAVRIQKLQFAMLILSRDIEQAVNRPILNAAGREEAAFIGTKEGFTFTHMGMVNLMGIAAKSSMQRTQYVFAGNGLLRVVWPQLDLAPRTKPQTRQLIFAVNEIRFEYLGADNRFYTVWPTKESKNGPLPLAVRLFLSLPKWGKMSELYVIPAETAK